MKSAVIRFTLLAVSLAPVLQGCGASDEKQNAVPSVQVSAFSVDEGIQPGGTATSTDPKRSHSPVARDDVFEVDTAGATALNVVRNDIDIDGNALAVSIAQQPFVGSASVNADGTVKLELPAGFHGMTRFKYSITDPHQGTSTATAVAFIDIKAYRYIFAGVVDAGKAELFITDFTAPRQLTDSADSDLAIGNFVASADGSIVAFSRAASSSADTPPKLFFVRTAPGSVPVEIAAPEGRQFRGTNTIDSLAISADGRWIAVTTTPTQAGGAAQPDLYIVDTQNPAALLPVGYELQARSSELRFARTGTDLYFISAAGSSPGTNSVYRVAMGDPAYPVRLSAPPASNKESVRSLILSPADESIYFLGERGNPAREAVYHSDPRAPETETAVTWDLAPDESVSQFSIANDGSMLFYTSTHGNPAAGVFQVNRIDLLSGSASVLLRYVVGMMITAPLQIRPDNGAVLVGVMETPGLFQTYEVSAVPELSAPLRLTAYGVPKYYDYSGTRFLTQQADGMPSVTTRVPRSVSEPLATSSRYQALSYPDRAVVHFTDSTFAPDRPAIANLDALERTHIIGNHQVPTSGPASLRTGVIVGAALTQ